MMAAQGWEEGQFLGATNANHSEHYTAANASHIRVTIREDNLGLGARVGSGVGAGECVGLDAFKDILGRLNGKDEDIIAKEQKSREDLKRAIYTERKWGSQRFVPGGVLIGDKIQDLIDGEAERIRTLAIAGTSSDASSDSSDSSSEEEEEEEEATPELHESRERSKKRKVEDEVEVEGVSSKTKKSKKQKVESQVDSESKPRKSKKEKRMAEGRTAEVVAVKMKRTKKSRKSKSSHAEEQVEVSTEDSEELSEKQQRKKDRREKKARREKENSEAGEESVNDLKKKAKKEKKKRKLEDISESEPTTTLSTPASASGTSTPMMQGRHAVRARNIAQKRLASMDVASLNQVSSLVFNV